jgi:hypothetical protein
VAYPATRTFWLEPTNRVAVGLRRYRSAAADTGCAGGYHSALVYTGRAPARWRDTDHGRSLILRPATPSDDPLWPTVCDEGCGYQFTPGDHWQDWQELIYRRADTGEETTIRTAAPGAMWDAWWMPASWHGPDGIALMARCPNGRDWHIDGEASNCTRKGDRRHKCWVRHGDPRAANLTVDKNGETCAAGAGSIQAGDYHGFLTRGSFTTG